MHISVSHEADEQLEELTFMLGQEAFRHANRNRQPGLEQDGQLLSVNGFQQKLQNSESNHVSPVVEIRPDPQREQRKGVPEIIFGETKDPGQIIAMTRNLLEETGRAIISRVQPEAVEALRESFQTYTIRTREAAHAVVIYRPDYVRRSTGGLVGVISAGTSDIPVAEEAALIAEEMGCHVTCIYDVGVAGLHRLMEPLRNLLSNGVDVIIVAAGMDGALPSVVAGLGPVPVIGFPNLIGYGMGGQGVAAFHVMFLNSVTGHFSV